jgi:hypothetical protein
VDNQHREIKGYRELTKADIALMNEVKEHGSQLEALLAKLTFNANVDRRWIVIGETHLQQGLMALTRAVAKPESF